MRRNSPTGVISGNGDVDKGRDSAHRKINRREHSGRPPENGLDGDDCFPDRDPAFFTGISEKSVKNNGRVFSVLKKRLKLIRISFRPETVLS